MILCQICLSECPEGATTCVTCGEPLAVRPGSQKTVPVQLLPHLIAALPTPDHAAADYVAADYGTLAETAPRIPAWQPSTTPPDDTPAPAPRVLTLSFSDGAEITLTGKEDYLVGRRDASLGIFPEVDVTEHGGQAAGVSRAHAVIHERSEGYFIEDLESTNDTLRNFQRLLPRQLYMLEDGDQLRFGLLSAAVTLA